jgi:chromosome segregation ATPase
MASIDDVDRTTIMLLDALVRIPPYGMTGGMGQVGSFPGLAPATYRAAQKARDVSEEILTVVEATSALLNAVNVETLGRIEARSDSNAQTLVRVETAINDGRAKNDQTLGRIEADLEEVKQFLPTVREDMNDLRAMLDKIVEELQKGMTDLNAKLTALKTDIQALPH